MTIRHLKIFVAICEEGGVTRASEALHIAQPSVSFTLSEIEKYYHVALFERVHQRLVITEAGKELLLKAKNVLSAFDEFENTAFHTNDHPIVRIGSSLTLGKTRLPHLLQKLKYAFPEVKFQVKIDKTSIIESELIEGRLDFAIVEGKVSSPALLARPFSKDRLIAVVGTSYSIADKITLSELCSHSLLLREKGSASRDLLDNALVAASLSVIPMLESISNEAIISAAEENLGIAILPEELVLSHITKDRLRKITILDNRFERQAFLLSHKSKKFSSLQKKIYNLCAKETASFSDNK